MDRIFALKIFLTVAETGSFTSTADKLDISKPMVTRAVALLEEWFNARLLQRTTRRVSLTEAGEQAVDYCRKMANLTEEIEQDFSARSGELRGTLRVASNSSFGNSHLLTALQTFLRQHPKLNLQLQLSDDTVDLLEARIDLAIRITAQPDPNLVARKLADCHSLLVASPNYLAQRGEPTTPEALAQHRYLAHSHVNRKLWRFTQAEREVALDLTSQFTTNDSNALLNYVLAGGGIAMLPKFMISNHIADGRLLAVLTDWQLPKFHLYALYPSRHKLPHSVRALLDFLVSEFSGKDW